MSEFEIDIQKLLNDKRVIEEIQRHLWIESEKAGYDVGFEKAKEDWFKKFAVAWMEYHMPEELARVKKNANKTLSQKITHDAINKLKAFTSDALAGKRRRAKSYF